MLCRDAAVDPEIRSQIPNDSPFYFFKKSPHNPLFAPLRVRGVTKACIVRIPKRLGCSRFESENGLLQVHEQCLKFYFAKSSFQSRQWSVGIALLAFRMCKDVDQNPGFEFRRQRKQAGNQIERNAVKMRCRQPKQSGIRSGRKYQGSEKPLAELPISNPRLSFLIELKRKRINMDRLSQKKLGIKRTGIFEDHPEL